MSWKRVAVVGMGKSGKAATALLESRGIETVPFDEKTAPFPETFTGVDAVVVSPGVPLSKIRSSAPLLGEIELAWRLLPKGAGPILGVTGTNGKSTTTALLGELCGPEAFVGGNLGRPFSEACAKPYPVHVVELSSFQLEGIVDTVVLGSTLLNLQPDHLDRYASQREYGLAKARIFKNAPSNGFVVVNGEDPAVVELAKAAKVPVHAFRVEEPGAFTFQGERFTVTSRALRGRHNLQNAMAATMLARLYGIGREQCQRGLDSFPGLPHRLEWVRELDGVEWINDSKATNVDSSLVALAALKGPIWLIAGGKGKGAPYAPMVEASKGKVAGVLTIGQDAPTITAAYSGFDTRSCTTLATAIETARTLAKRGDTVLLSPACASYDQFDNFEHRGDTFKKLVKAL
jgi:UDP-N-acetylmuramoylalanine--D-glutamate ligase